MADFRLALAQINPTVGDLEGNTSRILSVMEEARALGADLVAFPELAVSGYPPEDLLLKPSFIRDNVAAMERIVAASGDMAVVVGYADMDSDIYNAAAIGYGGELVGVYRKIHLPTYGVFDEDRYFKKGSACPVYNINGVGAGVNICEDIWSPMGPMVVQRDAGAQVIVNINASPFHAGKAAFRERMVATRAQDNGVYVAYVNTVGGQDELVFDGASLVFGPSGELVARGEQFQEDLLVADLEMDQVFSYRLRGPRHRQGLPYLFDEIGEPEVVHVSARTPRPRPQIPSWNGRRPLEPAAEVYQALLLGVRDYVKKSGFEKTVIGLSGGIDSSLTACVAVDALGKENVVGVGMPSRYSSEGSLADAAELARRLGIDFWVVPIEPAHGAFQDMLEPVFQGYGTQHGRGERSGPYQGQHNHVHLEQVRVAGPHHRQQERDGHGIRHAVRRHGGRVRSHQGRAQNISVYAEPVAQRERLSETRHPRRCVGEAPQRRAAPRPDGPGQPTALRSLGPGGRSLRRRGPQLPGHGGHGVRP